MTYFGRSLGGAWVPSNVKLTKGRILQLQNAQVRLVPFDSLPTPADVGAPALQKPATRRGSKTQFNSFVTQMLSNLADREGSEDDDARTAGTATIRGLSSHSMIHGSPSSHGMIRNLDDDQLGADSGLGGCRESVEILTRVSKKGTSHPSASLQHRLIHYASVLRHQ